MALPGKIVEYVDQGKFLCAVVMEDTGRRLRLLSENNREVSLNPSRLVHQGTVSREVKQPREELLKELKAVAGRRHELQQTIPLAELWELAAETPDSTFAPQFLAELWFGEEAGDDQVAALLRAVFADRLFFKYKEGAVVAHSPEAVEQLREKQEKERRQQELLEEGAKGLQKLMEGEEAEWPTRDLCLEMVRDFYLFGNDAPESGLARELLKKAQLFRPHDPYHLLVRAGIWQEHENFHLLRHQVPVAFGSEVAERAQTLAAPDLEALLAEKRRDLTGLPLLTIDGESTRDYDDALHLEEQGDHYLVGIHIADVARFVAPGDPLFQEAEQRTTSLYFPDQQIPMLPEAVSEDLCSLLAGQPRAALSFLVKLSPAAEVLDYQVVTSVVAIQRQLSYPEADQLLDSGDEELRILCELSQKLRQRRVQEGAVLLPIPDVEIDLRSGDGTQVRISEVDTRARTLVAEFMVLANSLGARFLADRQVPGLFRSQGPPRKRLVHGVEKDLFLNFRQRRFLSPGKLSTVPEPHSGVGVMQYTTVTSPIRRLLDLLMQHQIKGELARTGAVFTEAALVDYSRLITTTQSRLNLVRQLRHRYWILRYLEERQEERFEALILEWTPKSVQCLLLDFLLEADLPPNRAANGEPGEVVRVSIARVSALDNILRLTW